MKSDLNSLMGKVLEMLNVKKDKYNFSVKSMLQTFVFTGYVVFLYMHILLFNVQGIHHNKHSQFDYFIVFFS